MRTTDGAAGWRSPDERGADDRDGLARSDGAARGQPGRLPQSGEERFRQILAEHFDFAELRALAWRPGAPILCVGAVEVLTGHFETFPGEELSADCLLASALQHLHARPETHEIMGRRNALSGNLSMEQELATPRGARS